MRGKDDHDPTSWDVPHLSLGLEKNKNKIRIKNNKTNYNIKKVIKKQKIINLLE